MAEYEIFPVLIMFELHISLGIPNEQSKSGELQLTLSMQILTIFFLSIAKLPNFY